jgi:hypothetical protein
MSNPILLWLLGNCERRPDGHLLYRRRARRYRPRPAGALRSYVVRINGRKHYVHRALFQLATGRRL